MTMAKKTKAAVDTDIARKIWLAGVGAYGRVLSETQDRVGKIAGTANTAFDQLVASGEKVEDTVRARIAKSDASERVTALVGTVTKQAKAQREAFEDRLGSARKTVIDALAPYSILTIGKHVEKLSKQVDALQKEVAVLKGQKATRKKA